MLLKIMTMLALCGYLRGSDQIVIGIAGGTASGKTTFANLILEALPGEAVLISQDAYYKELGHLTLEQREQVNFDHPTSIDFDLLVDQVANLKSGKVIEKPIYNFKTHTRERACEKITSNRVIIVEGILLFALPQVRDLFDIRIFIDTDDDIRLVRRIERDINERGRTLKSVRTQYLATVKPMHELFVKPSKKYADLIVSGNTDNTVALKTIVSRLRSEK